jgi:Flp pilus assembly protein TadG
MREAWIRNSDGSAAIEFAVLGPLLTVMLLGIIAYGGCFWISHSVQQLANDAARAAVGGLSTAERQSLAQATLASEAPTYPNLTANLATLSESETGQIITVSIAYDASASVFWAMKNLIPMPPSTIVRQATIQLGGY